MDNQKDLRMMKQTGLNRYEIKFYKLFCDSADLTNGLVIPDTVKDDLAEIVEGEYDDETDSWDDSINESYNKWLEIFKTKGLLIKLSSQNFSEDIILLHQYGFYNNPDI